MKFKPLVEDKDKRIAELEKEVEKLKDRQIYFNEEVELRKQETNKALNAELAKNVAQAQLKSQEQEIKELKERISKYDIHTVIGDIEKLYCSYVTDTGKTTQFQLNSSLGSLTVIDTSTYNSQEQLLEKAFDLIQTGTSQYEDEVNEWLNEYKEYLNKKED